MAFIVKGSDATFTPAPAGTHNAVCVDVVDLGMQQTSFGEKHRCRFVWEIDELRPEHGDRFLVFATMNVSLHESSTMGKLLRSWRGRDFTAEEMKGFDVENVVGAPCMLSVVHNEGTNGNTYANVNSATPLPRGLAPLKPSGDYERQKDREEESKDVRAESYTAPDRAPQQQAKPQGSFQPAGPAPTPHAGEPSYGHNFAADGDDLPF